MSKHKSKREAACSLVRKDTAACSTSACCKKNFAKHGSALLNFARGTVSQTPKTQRFRRFRHTSCALACFAKSSLTKLNFARGFSLVEIMVSLIVISIIAAVFAPVISKKLENSALTAGNTTQVSDKCNRHNSDGTYSINEYCKLCDKTTCLSCNRTCSVGQYQVLSSCTCANCPSKCSACISSSVCTSCKNPYSLNGSSCD